MLSKTLGSAPLQLSLVQIDSARLQSLDDILLIQITKGNDMNIDHNSPIPLYHQLKELLKQQIQSEMWQEGDRLPGEQQLEETHQISRTTVRQALKELEAEGLITRHPGRGTFVAPLKIGEGPEPLHTITDNLMEQGVVLGWRILAADWRPAPPPIAERLQIEPNTETFHLRRLRLANDDPFAYITSYVSPDFAGAIDLSALSSGGTLEYLRGLNNLHTYRADRFLEATPATEEESKLLGVTARDPMLLIKRVIYDKDGQPVEDFRGIYRGDRFQYHVLGLPAIQEA